MSLTWNVQHSFIQNVDVLNDIYGTESWFENDNFIELLTYILVGENNRIVIIIFLKIKKYFGIDGFIKLRPKIKLHTFCDKYIPVFFFFFETDRP